MSKNGNKDVVKLWGHDFKRVSHGLDEKQLFSFVNQLISQRDTLLQREEQLTSLTTLAEKTVGEADKLAEELKQEAIDQAKAEAKAILAKAEEEAQQMVAEKRAEVIAMANREAAAIKVKAQQQAELLLEEEQKKLQPELKNTAQRLYRELRSQLESLKQPVAALWVNFEQTLSQPAKQTKATPMEQALSSHLSATMESEANIASDTDSEISLAVTPRLPTEDREQVPPEGQTDGSQPGEKGLVATEQQEMTDYDGEVALEILPPLDIKQIMGIMRYLDSLTEVENTELIPVTDRPAIIVFLRQPLHLLAILRTLPEVAQVREVIDEEVTAISNAVPARDKRRKLQIKLSGNPVLDGAKEILNSEVSPPLSL